MRINFKNGGWIEGEIKTWDPCDCPTCTCPPTYLIHWNIHRVDGTVRMAGSVGADITSSSSEEEKTKMLQSHLISFGVNIYDK